MCGLKKNKDVSDNFKVYEWLAILGEKAKQGPSGKNHRETEFG